MATIDILKSRILSVYGIEQKVQKQIENVIQKAEPEYIFNGEPSIDISIFDDLKQILIKKSKDFLIQKSFELLDSDLDIQKGMNRTGLHPEKVTIHSKDHGDYQAIRWISNDTGKAAKINGFKGEDDHEGKDIHEKATNIVNGDMKKHEKAKALVGLGIYDKKHIDNVVSGMYGNTVLNAAGVDKNNFKNVELDDNGNIKDAGDILTSSDPKAGNKYKPDIDVTMSMEDAQEALSAKDFDKYKKKLLESMREKFGITADKMWLSYERNIERLIDTGQPKSMLAFGTGGVGKTWTLEQVLERKKIRMYQNGFDMQPGDYDAIKITGSTSKAGVWKRLYENKEGMVIFDDCDSLWDDPDCLNWLKGALDSSGDGTINYDMGDRVKTTVSATRRVDNGDFEDEPEEQSSGSGRCPTEFQFTGKVIFISNLTSSQLVKKGAGPLVESRCLSMDLTMNLEQTMSKLKKIKDTIILKDNKGNALPGITQEDRDMAFQFIDEMKANVPVSKINGRTLGNLIGTAAYLRKKGELTPENFTDEALATFLS